MPKFTPWFAWRPVYVRNGYVVWLREVRRRWNPKLRPIRLLNIYLGGWEYIDPLHGKEKAQ